MAPGNGRWRRIEADGAEWETRVVAGPGQTEPSLEAPGEILEFVCVDGSRKPRQVAVDAGALERMDEDALHRAYRRARPIGGEYYGRPGKRMNDLA